MNRTEWTFLSNVWIRSRYALVNWTDVSLPMAMLNWRSGMVAASNWEAVRPPFGLTTGAGAALAPTGETTTVKVAAVARVSKARLRLRTTLTALVITGPVNRRKSGLRPPNARSAYGSARAALASVANGPSPGTRSRTAGRSG